MAKLRNPARAIVASGHLVRALLVLGYAIPALRRLVWDARERARERGRVRADRVMGIIFVDTESGQPPAWPAVMQECIEMQTKREVGAWRVGDRVQLVKGIAGEILAFRCAAGYRSAALVLLDGSKHTAVWPLVELARP